MNVKHLSTLAATLLVGAASTAYADYTVYKISSQYVATNAASGLLLNMSVINPSSHTLRFDGVRANPQSTTVLDLACPFIGEDGETGWTLTRINSGAAGAGEAPIKTILTEVLLPETLEEIYGSAFNGCSKLTKVTPFLPPSVKVIQNHIFYGVPVAGDLKLSNPNLTIINASAFLCEGSQPRNGITSVDFTGSGVTTIDAYAFGNSTNLAEVTLPEKLTTINGDAFNSCTKLTKVTPLLPGTLTTLGYRAFYYVPIEGDLVLTNENLTAVGTLAFCQHSTKRLGRIRSVTMKGSGVKTIGSCAFSYQPALTNVVLSGVLTKIEDSAFVSCTNLTTVTPFFPATVTSLGTKCFEGDPVEGDCVLSNPELKLLPQSFFAQWGKLGRLRSIDFTGSGVTEIGPYAAQQQPYLERVVLPEKLEKIGADTFYACRALTNVTPLLPETCYSIGARCFDGAPITGDFVMSNKKATSLGGTVFNNSKFTTVDLSKTSITTLGAYAFANNNKLTKVILPKTLTTFDVYVFYATSNMRQVYYSNDFGMPPLPGYSIFFGVEKQKWLRIYIPYKNTPKWDEYFANYGRALTDDEKAKFRTDYPGERLPVGLVPYPKASSRDCDQEYLCRWNPDGGQGTMLIIR